jgi:crotonobetainyl-CoA:carnitine CoA-transferase CaiB-like acyl-CoA transferase
LDYETLRAIKQDIILTTQTAYGHEGPWAERGGFDGIGQVMSGAAYFSGVAGEPAKSSAAYVDFGTALYSAFGTLAALYQRRDTGRGQHVQASLLGTAMTFFSPLLIEQAALAANRVPSGNRSQTSSPSDIFATSDGHVLLHVVGNGIFRRLCQALGRDDWIEDAALQSDEDRGAERDRICGHVAEWCRERSVDDVLDVMAQAGVPCGPVLDPAAAVRHPQVEAMEFFKRLPLPGLPGGVAVADFPVSMSGAAAGLRSPMPGTGEHGAEILAEIGYDSEEIMELRSLGAIE